MASRKFRNFLRVLAAPLTGGASMIEFEKRPAIVDTETVVDETAGEGAAIGAGNTVVPDFDVNSLIIPGAVIAGGFLLFRAMKK